MPEKFKLKTGIKLVIGFHILNLVLWSLGQTGAVINYDTIAAWGLQDARELIDPALVEVNRGIGLADTLVMFPLFIIGIIGLLKNRFYGAVASWMVFGITIYWPVVFWCSQLFYASEGIKHAPLNLATVFIPALFMGLALWFSWYLYRIRDNFQR